MKNSIEKNFDTFSLLRFALPSMIMMVFMSLYTIIDGIFISHFVGDDGLSATNIVYPAISILLAVGIMLSTGGCAVVARKLGQGRAEDARENFTFLVFAGLLFAIISLIAGNVWLTPLVRLMGATDQILSHCEIYLGILLYFAPACILQVLFQTFFVADGQPALGLFVTIAGGIANAVLDYLFMGVLHLGIAGAALATGIGQCIPAIIGLLYFCFHRKNLYFTFFHPDLPALWESCLNGSSEMVTNLSTAVVTYLFNIIMLQLLGEEGVAAIAIVLYAQFLFNALFMGYSMGVAPVISFNYGKQNHVRLLRIYRICILFIIGASILITILAYLTSNLVIGVFTPSGTHTFQLASRGFLLFSISFLFAGINIFASSLFTALSDGKTSAMISFLRTFAFLAGSILLLPHIIGADGVWLSVPLAELMTNIPAAFKLHKFRFHTKALLSS